MIKWIVLNVGLTTLANIFAFLILMGITYCAYKLGQINERIDNLLSREDIKDIQNG